MFSLAPSLQTEMTDFLDALSKRSAMMILNWSESGNYPANKLGDKFVDICSKGHLDELKKFYLSCTEGEKQEVVCYAGNRALRMAAKNEHLSCVIELIENCGADIHASSDYLDGLSLVSSHDAVIGHACANDDSAMLKYLFSKHPAKLCTDHKARNTTSNLRSSIGGGRLEIIKMLYQHGETKDEPLRGIYYGTPTDKLVPLFELFIDELKYQPTLSEWNHILTNSIGHKGFDALVWIWERCPDRGSLDLKAALRQACGKTTYGPHPCLDYLIDVCGCKVAPKLIGGGFCVTTYNMNGRVDRTPFFDWVEHKGFKLKGNQFLIQKAKRYDLTEVVAWLESSPKE